MRFSHLQTLIPLGFIKLFYFDYAKIFSVTQHSPAVIPCPLLNFRCTTFSDDGNFYTELFHSQFYCSASASVFVLFNLLFPWLSYIFPAQLKTCMSFNETVILVRVLQFNFRISICVSVLSHQVAWLR